MPAKENLPDYYDLLGLYSDADSDAVKRAYRSLAKAFHPDTSTHPNAVERFRKINEAYEILSDEERRKDYDSRIFSASSCKSEELSKNPDFFSKNSDGEPDEFSMMADYEFYSGETEHFLINGKKTELENIRHIIIGETEYIIIKDEMINIGGIHRFTHEGYEKYLIEGEEKRVFNAEHYYQNGSEFVIIENKPYRIKSF